MTAHAESLVDPTKLYQDIQTPEQYLEGSGLDSEMKDRADLGEESYVGSGRLTGRRALITGGDSGIGGATAIAFAREGADVAISYLPEEESDAQRIAGLIRDAGRTAVLLPGDLTSAEYCRSLVDQTVSELGGIDILVNNGGKQQNVADLTDITDEEFDATVKTNVYAMFWITKAALPHLPAGSSIINTSSIQAYSPSEHLVHYAMTKAAINNFSKGLAQQLAPKGIRVNAVAPGPIWTPLQAAGGQPPEALPEAGSQTGVGRWGQPAELAPAFVYLASADATYVAGETLNVNGGMATP
jgi:NAD(P)-dependent dehydrogenase (short-subunit alcohol dehydrogenase family)